MLLTLEAAALLMVQPAKLLQNLCMVRVSIQDSAVSKLGIVVLH